MRKPFLILIAAPAIAAVVTLGGCANRQLTESYDQFLQTVGAEYIRYVEADHALTVDDKAIRFTNVEQAEKTVAKFKATKWSW